MRISKVLRKRLNLSLSRCSDHLLRCMHGVCPSEDSGVIESNQGMMDNRTMSKETEEYTTQSHSTRIHEPGRKTHGWEETTEEEAAKQELARIRSRIKIEKDRLKNLKEQVLRETENNARLTSKTDIIALKEKQKEEILQLKQAHAQKMRKLKEESESKIRIFLKRENERAIQQFRELKQIQQQKKEQALQELEAEYEERIASIKECKEAKLRKLKSSLDVPASRNKSFVQKHIDIITTTPKEAAQTQRTAPYRKDKELNEYLTSRIRQQQNFADVISKLDASLTKAEKLFEEQDTNARLALDSCKRALFAKQRQNFKNTTQTQPPFNISRQMRSFDHEQREAIKDAQRLKREMLFARQELGDSSF